MNTEKERMDYKKSGYLHSDYRMFYLKDSFFHPLDFHYHDFHKILIFLSGNASYVVEGRQYELRPLDMLLITAGEIHKPIVHTDSAYERIILYLSPLFFTKNSTKDTDLFACFRTTGKQHTNLIRLKDAAATPLSAIVLELSTMLQPLQFESVYRNPFGTDLYEKIKVLEYLILLNRIILTEQVEYSKPISGHPVVLSIMEYINNHITDELSIEQIAERVFLNRSYIMHLFKNETGYTIGRYITNKRLFLVNQYRNQGMSVTEACYKSGFRNYSAYYHASRQESFK